MRDAEGQAEADVEVDVERMLLAAIEAAPLGIGVLDADLRLLRANLALTRALDADLLRPHAVEALARAVSLRLSDRSEPDEGGPWQVRLYPLARTGGEGSDAGGPGSAWWSTTSATCSTPSARRSRPCSRSGCSPRRTIDALANELAILDQDGRIVMVNRAWRDFGAGNDPAGRDFVGESYLAACAASEPGTEGSDDARTFAEGLRDLITGRRARVELEYPCHSPTEQRWFMARAARFESGGEARIVVTHENITARRRSEERHRHIAATLQRSLLPAAMPEVAGLELAARHRAQGEGLEVGGDFYDVFPDGDDWLLVIGDVCGKGPEAAAVTAEARWTIRALAHTAPGPAALLRVVNRELAGRRRDFTFLSAAVVRVTADSVGARVVCARAGHPHPLVLRAGGEVESVECAGGLLGIFPRVDFGERTLRLGPGEALVLHTDGVSEARRGTRELGAHGVRAALAGAAGQSAPAVARRLEQAALDFSGGRPREDVAIVVVRASPQAGAGPSAAAGSELSGGTNRAETA